MDITQINRASVETMLVFVFHIACQARCISFRCSFKRSHSNCLTNKNQHLTTTVIWAELPKYIPVFLFTEQAAESTRNTYAIAYFGNLRRFITTAIRYNYYFFFIFTRTWFSQRRKISSSTWVAGKKSCPGLTKKKFFSY